MKKLLLFLIIAVNCKAQQAALSVGIWGVSPNPICAGDSVKIDYKVGFGGINPAAAEGTFVLVSPNTATYSLWRAYTSVLMSQPKEQFGSNVADTTHFVWRPFPNVAAGSYTVMIINGSGTGTSTSQLSFPVAHHPIVSLSNSTICAGNSFTIQPAGNATSYTYSPSQIITPSATDTYTIIGESGGCYTTKTIELAVEVCTGINELYLKQSVQPTYYDLQGNLIEKRYNELIIECRWPHRRKVLISAY